MLILFYQRFSKWGRHRLRKGEMVDRSEITVVGIDLAGSPKRPTGFCVAKRDQVIKLDILYSDEEIIAETKKASPAVVAIDAPLAIPLSRKSIEDRNGVHLRECDRELLKMKIKFFPITLGPMRKLTTRGIEIRKKLEKLDFKVIETYPGAAQDILEIPRKNKGVDNLKEALIRYGIGGEITRQGVTHDELDAVTCAIVAQMYADGNYLAIGNPKEILMILPKIIGSLL